MLWELNVIKRKWNETGEKWKEKMQLRSKLEKYIIEWAHTLYSMCYPNCVHILIGNAWICMWARVICLIRMYTPMWCHGMSYITILCIMYKYRASNIICYVYYISILLVQGSDWRTLKDGSIWSGATQGTLPSCTSS